MVARSSVLARSLVVGGACVLVLFIGCGDSSEGGSGGGGSPNAGSSTGGLAGSGADDSGGTGGSGNSTSSGGSAGTATGGSNGGTRAGGEGGESGSGGGNDGGASGESGGGGLGGALGEEPPIVLILMDGSSSMFEPREQIWDPMHAALTDPSNGVITEFQDRVRFGFAVFRGSATPVEETDPACATIGSVAYAADNRPAIETLYADASDDFTPGTVWRTPTGHAIRRTATELAALTFEPPGRKYILLVTDGNPNTCTVVNPACGQDSSIAATQYARSLGITTLAAGIGDILQGNSGCPVSARCGTNHLQDLANAGTGQAVQAPSDTYRFEQCVTNMMLTATYATPAGTATFYSGTNEGEYRAALRAAVTSILGGTLP